MRVLPDRQDKEALPWADLIGELKDASCRGVPRADSQITLPKSVGAAIEDLFAARTVAASSNQQEQI